MVRKAKLMRMATMCGLIGLVTATMWSSLRPEQAETSPLASEPGGGARDSSASEQGSVAGAEPSSRDRARGRLQASDARLERGAGPTEVGDEHDAVARQFEELAPRDQTRLLTRQFDSAIARLRTDVGDAEQVRLVEDALSSLRSRLYTTERGKREHRKMEDELMLVLADAPTSSSETHELDSAGGMR